MHFHLTFLLWLRQRQRRRQQWKIVESDVVVFLLDSIFKVLYVVCVCPFLQCAIIISCDLLALTFLLSTNLFIVSFCGEKFSPQKLFKQSYIYKTCRIQFYWTRPHSFPSYEDLHLCRFYCPWFRSNIFRYEVWQRNLSF